MSPKFKIPLADLRAQYLSIQTELDEAWNKTNVSSGYILGAEVEAFEKEFAQFCGASFCVGVANGTDALELALSACGVKKGDEVITVAHTFIATAEAISNLGAIPIFVDINPDTLLLDPARLTSVLTTKTRAIVPVHLYGQPVDMDPVLTFARQHGLKVVEDAAQAHGARYKGRRVGSLSDATIFSFFPGKNLGAYGDAGAVVTNDASIAAWVRKARNHGRANKYEHEFCGRNSRMDGLQGAILNAKLKHLEDWNLLRQEHAARYDSMLQGIPGLVRVAVSPDCKPVWHLYVVRLKNRDDVLKGLKDQDIEAGIHYPIPLHLQKAFAYLGRKKGDLPHTERAAAEVLSLPLYPEMTTKNQNVVVRVLKSLINNAH